MDMNKAALASLAVLAAAACNPAGQDAPKASKAPATAAEIVEAASDPCQAVQGAYGKWLCGDPELAPIMQQVRDNLKQAAANISTEGAQVMAAGQKDWVEAVRIECAVATGEAPLTADQETCVRTSLESRVKEAANAVQSKGGFVFQTVEINKAVPATGEIAASLGPNMPVTQEIRFPKIDGETPQIKRFNDLMTQRPQYNLTDQTSEIVNYAIAYAGAELVSVRFDSSEYTVGAAHPSNGSKAVTVVMATGEPLAVTDVFAAPEAKWKAFLTTRALRDLTRQLKEFSPDGGPPKDEVADTLSKPQNWLIRQEALVLLFPPSSIGLPHAVGGFEVKVKWADLEPLLNPNAPAPIKPAA
jgi:hypothetical protein